MPYSVSYPDRAQHIAEVVNRLLGESGTTAVTTRAIATGTGLSLSSLAHHFGGRRRLMSVSGHLSGQAHLRRVDERISIGGIGAIVADDDESRMLDRAWLGWLELGRHDDHLAFALAEHEASEGYLIGRLLEAQFGAPVSSDQVALLTAAVRGVRAAVCRLEEPMPAADARRLLERLTALMAGAPASQSRGAAASAVARSCATMRSGSAAE